MEMSECELKELESRDLYTIGWIAALDIELAAAALMLDEEHGTPLDFEQPTNDGNVYVWGRIGEHNIVIASLSAGRYGSTSAADTARWLASSFPQIRIGLLVGIGAGIARHKEEGTRKDIRLGDVIVSQPDGRSGGVIQHDMIKDSAGGELERRFHLNSPPQVLLSAIQKLKAFHMRKPSKMRTFISKATSPPPHQEEPELQLQFNYQGVENDRLFRSCYQHVPCLELNTKTCTKCDPEEQIPRDPRKNTNPRIHYGTIASGNRLIKDGLRRDEIYHELCDKNVMCFEMEASGLMNNFPCLVIRGVSDYADSHKNDIWQPYAALTAAAYAKELLGFLPSRELIKSQRIVEIIGRSSLVEKAVQDSHERIVATESKLEKIQQENLTAKLHKWLSPPDPSNNLNKATELRAENSGNWFLESSSFSRWRSGKRKCMWLHGLPGSGKTILSSTVINHLDHEYAESSYQVIRFFFDFSDTQKQSFDFMLRCFLWQMAGRTPSSMELLDEAYQDHDKGKKEPSVSRLILLFDRMLKSSKGVRIVIDAMDECPQRSQLLAWIKSICESNPDGIGVFITGRAEKDISESLSWIQEDAVVKLSGKAVDLDIHNYIRGTLYSSDGGFQRWKSTPEVLQKIEVTLTKKANGMFRWVACQLDYLKKCWHPGSVDAVLRALPATLYETYGRIMKDLQVDPNRDIIIRMLQLLLYAKNPMSADQVAASLAVDLDGHGRYNPSARIQNPNQVLPSISPFITCKTQDHILGKQTNTIVTVILSHFSVKEYLLSGEIEPSLQYDFRPEIANGTLTRICLAGFLLPELGQMRDPPKHLDTILASKTQSKRKHPHEISSFFDGLGLPSRYISFCWGSHARESDSIPAVRDAIITTLKDEYGFLYRLTRVTRSIEDVERAKKILRDPSFAVTDRYDYPIHGLNDTNLVPPIVIAAREGLFYVVQELLKQKSEQDVRDSSLQKALILAARGGSQKIVALLLKTVAQTVLQPAMPKALLEATIAGAYDTVVSLLDTGVDVNSRLDFGDTPIYMAISTGRIQIAQLLLETGAKIYNREERESTGLLLAVSLSLRWQLQAAPSALAFRYGRMETIHSDIAEAAVDNNSLEGLEFILRISDVARAAKDALLARCFTNGENVRAPALVKMLLEKGANPNSRAISPFNHERKSYESVGGGIHLLALAAAYDHSKSVEYLLDSGADINAQSEFFSGRYQETSQRTVVEFLLGYYETDGYTTADFNDISQKPLRVLKRPSQPIISIPGDALFAAIEHDWKTSTFMMPSFITPNSLQVLLSRGANANSVYGKWEVSILMIAATRSWIHNRHMATIDELVRAGADIRYRSKHPVFPTVMEVAGVICRTFLKKVLDVVPGSQVYLDALSEANESVKRKRAEDQERQRSERRELKQKNTEKAEVNADNKTVDPVPADP